MANRKSTAGTVSLPLEIQRSLSDRDRICPVIAGPAFVRNGHMTVHLPNREADIKAPPKLLKHLVQNCDGSRSFNEIIQAADPRNRKTFTDFMRDLVRRGILVDAANYLPSIVDVVHESDRWGRSTPREVSIQIHKLPQIEGENVEHFRPIETPLTPLLRDRASVSTFDDKDLTAGQLSTLLWSMYSGSRLPPTCLSRRAPCARIRFRPRDAEERRHRALRTRHGRMPEAISRMRSRQRCRRASISRGNAQDEAISGE